MRSSGARFADPDESEVREQSLYRVSIPVIRVEYYDVYADDADHAEEVALMHRKHAGQVSGFGPTEVDYDNIVRECLEDNSPQEREHDDE